MFNTPALVITLYSFLCGLALLGYSFKLKDRVISKGLKVFSSIFTIGTIVIYAFLWNMF